MDRLGGGGRSFTSFTDCVQVYGLTEIWRWKHPNVCKYSCHSDSFHTMSRIDMAFASDVMLPIVSKVSYLLGVSEHVPLSVDLLPPPGLRFHNLVTVFPVAGG